MKPHPSLIVLFVALTSLIIADRNVRAEEADTPTSEDAKQYLVELSEYELDQAIPTGLNEAETIEKIYQSGGKPVETIRLTAMAESKSMVQYGTNVTMTTAKTYQGNSTSRQSTARQTGSRQATSRKNKDVNVGIILRLSIRHHAKGVVADVNYATTRIDGAGTDDSFPDVLTNSLQATQVYALGKPRLLTTVGSSKTTAVVVTVRETE